METKENTQKPQNSENAIEDREPEGKSSRTVVLSRLKQIQKFIRDPIHDIIKIDNDLLLRVLDSEPMQRLRSIKQLGTAYLVYPGAEHSRFTHSLGVYHLATSLMNQLESEGHEIDDYDRLVVKLAALLHDTGHGPFSHLFEAVLKEVAYKFAEKHDSWSKKLIMEHKSLAGLLDKYSPFLKRDVTDVLSNSYKPLYLSSIVNAQFDVDRLDYMLRDSFMTGVNYGRFDLPWIFRNLSLKPVSEPDEDGRVIEVQRIALDAKRGLSSLEEFLLGNLNLYEHVYYHKTVQSANAIIISALVRAIDLLREGEDLGIASKGLSRIAKDEKLEVDDYLELTDGAVISWLTKWSLGGDDEILRDLSHRFLTRNLFKTIDFTDLIGKENACYRIREEIEKKLKQGGKDPRYYCVGIDSDRIGYTPLSADEIYVTQKDGTTRRYSEIVFEKDGNEVSKAIVMRLKLRRNLLVLPEEYVKFANEVKKGWTI
ncbi:MAG: HD domain-containing protein [Desulfobacteraceae bacterium]|nr:HD domain-containing protein [Desulfobacteraceae bacterium]